MSHLNQTRLNLMHRYWSAANYLTIGQIYLQDNPLLREPLRPEHIKPRLLGHWGTSPGLSFIYVHLNRLIQDHDVNMIYLAGPGHGGPAILANVYLEGTYSEVYPQVSQDVAGMQHLFRQFSTTGGVPSHVSVPTPGSIHEGGELGYVLAHAFGAAFDNPDLIVMAVVGDGEAETAPLEGAWKSIKFLNPVRDGAVLPILHLNGYKISGPTVMGANPHANGGKLLIDLELPSFTDYAIDVQKPATEHHESTRQLGKMLRDMFTRNANQQNFRLFCPDETNSNRLGNVFEVENRCTVGKIIAIDDHLSPDGRVMEVLSEHLCEGWLEGYLLTGRHGLFATYESFAMIADSMIIQHAKWLEEGIKLPWRTPVASLNILLTSTCWRNDHNGFSHQGPGLIDTVLSKKGAVARIYLPPDANCLLSVADHCFRSRDYVNLMVIDKQPQLQWMNMEDAIAHCNRGISTWHWASNDEHYFPFLFFLGSIPCKRYRLTPSSLSSIMSLLNDI